MKEEEYRDKKQFISDFNEAKFQIYRLGNSWDRCASFVRQGRFMEWNWELDIIKRELSADIKKLNLKGYTEAISKLDSMVSVYKKTPDKFYRILEKKEIIIREIQDEAGKGAKRSNPEDYEGMDG